MFLNVETGKRMFLQVSGISSYQHLDPMQIGFGTRYIKYNGIILTFLNYQQSILDKYAGLKKDYVKNPSDLVFRVIKIGPGWISKEKRTALVATLSKQHGSLVYNIKEYSDFNYTEIDFLAARKKCLLQGNSIISVHSPVRVDYSVDLKPEFRYRTYPSIIKLSLETGLPQDEILYRVNSIEYESWVLLSYTDFVLINKRRLVSMDRDKLNKIRINLSY